ncbi:DUF1206 domain-containing protein [Microcella sp.]|uniref:DUF1206 domain-containing protein n=1 Tax=Microcella sp. TaxID=1913979 RepID=UPI00391D66ED
MPQTPSRSSARQTTRRLHNSRTWRTLARTGFAVNGLLHILLGAIAIQLALPGSSDADADQSGALESLAATPVGGPLLWVVTVGLAALGLWLLVDGIIDRPDEGAVRHVAIACAKGLTYLAIAATAGQVALGGRTDSSGDAQSVTATLLEAPAGVVLVILAALIVLGIGVYFSVKGVTQGFRDDLDTPAGGAGTAVVALGVGGYLAKGVALGMVGLLIGSAAIASDSARSTGLDGALRSLLDLPFGAWILGAVGAGLIAYGVYCCARARYARLD